jgi:hypothetical protein
MAVPTSATASRRLGGDAMSAMERRQSSRCQRERQPAASMPKRSRNSDLCSTCRGSDNAARNTFGLLKPEVMAVRAAGGTRGCSTVHSAAGCARTCTRRRRKPRSAPRKNRSWRVPSPPRATLDRSAAPSAPQPAQDGGTSGGARRQVAPRIPTRVRPIEERVRRVLRLPRWWDDVFPAHAVRGGPAPSATGRSAAAGGWP